jgi:hypothetical protein
MYGGGAAKETFKNGSGLIYQERWGKQIPEST